MNIVVEDLFLLSSAQSTNGYEGKKFHFISSSIRQFKGEKEELTDSKWNQFKHTNSEIVQHINFSFEIIIEI